MTGIPLCDSHAHLSDEAYDADREAVAREALDGGLRFIVDVGTNPATWARSRALAEAVSGLVVTVGVHPHDAASTSADEVGPLLEGAWWEKARAVGEIGLDYHYDFSPRERQREVFEAQLAWAARRSVPSVIHVREAWDDALAILRRADLAAGGVVHCFSGTWDEARAVLDLGLCLSVTGVVAFPRSTELREIVARVPLDRLFLETDCPYLSPPPHRGRRNHPAHVRLVAEAVAAVRDEELARVADVTTAAAAAFFGVGV